MACGTLNSEEKCSMCGASPKFHYENAQGVRFIIPSSSPTFVEDVGEIRVVCDFDVMVCHNYINECSDIMSPVEVYYTYIHRT